MLYYIKIIWYQKTQIRLIYYSCAYWPLPFSYILIETCIFLIFIIGVTAMYFYMANGIRKLYKMLNLYIIRLDYYYYIVHTLLFSNLLYKDFKELK